jgi:hypothetical protein
LDLCSLHTTIAKQLKNLLNNNYEYFTIPISEITGELWGIYPNARNVTIQVVNSPNLEYQGAYDASIQMLDGSMGKVITLNAYRIRERLKEAGLDTHWNSVGARNRFHDILVHELQHFVQEQEGFSRGSNIAEGDIISKGFRTKKELL